MATTKVVPQESSNSVSDTCKCGDEGCLGHEMIDNRIFSPGFTSELAIKNSPHKIMVFDYPLTESLYAPGELSPDEIAAHPGPSLVRWRPL